MNYNGIEWSRGDEGEIVFQGKTIQRYRELDGSKIDLEGLGIFWAFSADQFDEGVQRLKERGLLREGEKLYRGVAGGYGIAGAWEKVDELYRDLHERQAAECNPQEVYFYEYNNHECMYGYEGDSPAWVRCLEVFGQERCNREIRRVR